MMGRPTNPLHTSPTVAGKFTMEAPCKLGNMLDASPIHHSCGMHDPVEVRDSSAPMLLRSVLMPSSLVWHPSMENGESIATLP